MYLSFFWTPSTQVVYIQTNILSENRPEWQALFTFEPCYQNMLRMYSGWIFKKITQDLMMTIYCYMHAMQVCIHAVRHACKIKGVPKRPSFKKTARYCLITKSLSPLWQTVPFETAPRFFQKGGFFGTPSITKAGQLKSLLLFYSCTSTEKWKRVFL